MNSSSTPVWTPKCGVHVPAELIPEAIEFEQNWIKYGIAKSALYEARMASYEAEWGSSSSQSLNQHVLDSSAMSTICEPSVSIPHHENQLYVSTVQEMSHLSTASYDKIKYFPPMDNQPLSSCLDEEDDDDISLFISPMVSTAAFSSHWTLADAKTGLSSAMDILCVSPNGGRPKAKAAKRSVSSGRKIRSSDVTAPAPAVPAKKKSAAASAKRKAVDELRRP
ncbi:hypothetical protein H310_06680 [Aphanomyces invadans]|uniref:Uncharacterized protein n=1 Tax=Aphanomyces invadans TaxID=157072 RepID=A0A024U494_9STRA|nr:hypothetical protein H310_06680 [Aphanomyces invadans]ETW01050.1 hypothetical protein H310_06680 [Aphanomyces invadans]|eukprot:XP_008870048.1 hypothetical protein H310_06680 [Aphanomyces invadans]